MRATAVLIVVLYCQSRVIAEDVLTAEPLSINFVPAHYALTPDGRYLMLANAEQGKVHFWDWATDEEEKRVSVQAGPTYIHVRGDTAWVANGQVSTLSVLDLAPDEMRVINTIDLPSSQPYYISSGNEEDGPLYVSCGQYRDRSVLLLDPRSESAEALFDEGDMSVFTVQGDGRTAVKQGEFGHSPRASPDVYRLSEAGRVGGRIGSLHESFGLLRPDLQGRYWLASGGIWDLTLDRHIARLECHMIVEHPTMPVFVTLMLGDRRGEGDTGTVSIISNTSFTSNFTRTFQLTLPENAGSDSDRRGNPYCPLLVTMDDDGNSVLLFEWRGTLYRLVISADDYTHGTSSVLTEPFPARIPAGEPFNFQFELTESEGDVRFKGLEIPHESTLDEETGEFTWDNPRPGDYDFAVKVIISPEDYFVLEERLTVVPTEAAPAEESEATEPEGDEPEVDDPVEESDAAKPADELEAGELEASEPIAEEAG